MKKTFGLLLLIAGTAWAQPTKEELAVQRALIALEQLNKAESAFRFSVMELRALGLRVDLDFDVLIGPDYVPSARACDYWGPEPGRECARVSHPFAWIQKITQAPDQPKVYFEVEMKNGWPVQ